MTTYLMSARAASRLNALAARMDALPLESTITPCGLLVRNPDRPGCCDAVRSRADRITCRRRWDDAHRLWFFTSWGEPITEATDVIGASVRILGYLAPVES